MQRGSESVYQYLRILFYGRVDEYVGDSVAGLLHSEPLLDGSLPEISVDHIIGSHPLMGLTASLVAKGCSSPRPPPNSVLQFLWSRSDPFCAHSLVIVDWIEKWTSSWKTRIEEGSLKTSATLSLNASRVSSSGSFSEGYVWNMLFRI